MNATVADAREYWRRYYAEQFRFGLGTEDVLAGLMQIPPVGTWVDFGSGSESLLWAIALRAQHLIAVDLNPARLDILRQFAHAAQPRGVHTTALRLCGRPDPDAFARRCHALAGLLLADCLAGPAPSELAEEPVELVTQFGLLGLCRDAVHFSDRFTTLHRVLEPGGWCAGANWVARDPTGRVDLTEALYQHAAGQAGITLLLLHRVPSADPDFPAVWTYVGRKTPS
ncbi:MAG: class I SAM-dependent methyltransferase [Pseudonocardia sp.]